MADGMEETIPGDFRNDLFQKQSQKDSADGGQVEVVDDEESLQFEGFSIAHPFATAKDYSIVDDDEDGCLLQS